MRCWPGWSGFWILALKFVCGSGHGGAMAVRDGGDRPTAVGRRDVKGNSGSEGEEACVGHHRGGRCLPSGALTAIS